MQELNTFEYSLGFGSFSHDRTHLPLYRFRCFIVSGPASLFYSRLQKDGKLEKGRDQHSSIQENLWTNKFVSQASLVASKASLPVGNCEDLFTI